MTFVAGPRRNRPVEERLATLVRDVKRALWYLRRAEGLDLSDCFAGVPVPPQAPDLDPGVAAVFLRRALDWSDLTHDVETGEPWPWAAPIAAPRSGGG